jgi:hypothetical protein
MNTEGDDVLGSKPKGEMEDLLVRCLDGFCNKSNLLILLRKWFGLSKAPEGGHTIGKLRVENPERWKEICGWVDLRRKDFNYRDSLFRVLIENFAQRMNHTGVKKGYPNGKRKRNGLNLSSENPSRETQPQHGYNLRNWKKTKHDKNLGSEQALIDLFQTWKRRDVGLSLPFAFSFPYWIQNDFFLPNVSCTFKFDQNQQESQVTFHQINLPFRLHECHLANLNCVNTSLFKDMRIVHALPFEFPPIQCWHSPVFIEAFLDLKHPRMNSQVVNLIHSNTKAGKLLFRYSIQKGTSILEFDIDDPVQIQLYVHPIPGVQDYEYAWVLSTSYLFRQDNWRLMHSNEKSRKSSWSTVCEMWQYILVLKEFVQSFIPVPLTLARRPHGKSSLREFLTSQSLSCEHLGLLILEFYWPHNQKFDHDSFAGVHSIQTVK